MVFMHHMYIPRFQSVYPVCLPKTKSVYPALTWRHAISTSVIEVMGVMGVMEVQGGGGFVGNFRL